MSSFPPKFSSENSIVLGLEFTSFCQFWNYFSVWHKVGVQFHCFAHEYHVFPTPFVDGTVFPQGAFLAPLLKTSEACAGLFLAALFCSVGLCVLNKWD